jgi:hypothetical protein
VRSSRIACTTGARGISSASEIRTRSSGAGVVQAANDLVALEFLADPEAGLRRVGVPVVDHRYRIRRFIDDRHVVQRDVADARQERCDARVGGIEAQCLRLAAEGAGSLHDDEPVDDVISSCSRDRQHVGLAVVR